MLNKKEKLKAVAATKSGMDEKTARKYLRLGRLPSQIKKPHNWQTRSASFKEIWEEAKSFLDNPGLEAKALFEYLQRKYPGKFQDGQLRTFQRKVKVWRATEGPGKEVYFPQKHFPGDLSESDFTHMKALGITIRGELFIHLIFHFVLTWSNWETGTICFSESFEALSEGFQNAFWELGGVCKRHRIDNLTAAVYKECNPEEFTPRYQGLLNHYSIKGEKINPGHANENGDIEQRHNRLKKAINQALILRGSRDFSSREEYEKFLKKIFSQLNSGRREKLSEELRKLRRLPQNRLNDFKCIKKKVGPSSTVSIVHKTYSVHSRLIGENLEVKLFSEKIEIWYGQKKVDQFPRLRRNKSHHIQYRHIIDWLVRKPGAFENYRYRDDLFPTIRFRMAYDQLGLGNKLRGAKEYTKILELAAKENEDKVDKALLILFNNNESLSYKLVEDLVYTNKEILSSNLKQVKVSDIELSNYDELFKDFTGKEVTCGIS
jgi:transposase